jgi:regulatory protein
MSDLDSNTQQSNKQSPSLKARALRLLSLREYSRHSLAMKLAESVNRAAKLNPTEAKLNTAPVSALQEQIEAILDDFEARGWLSDQRFAEALVRRRSERFGIRKIRDELEQAGVDSSQTTELLQGLQDSEYQRAHDLWLKKFGGLAKDQKERARQYRFLVSKGFRSEVVSQIIAGRLGLVRNRS